ncbi:MAG: hypothetical protein RJQ04_18225 [Longimicrobiales bacterium]
MHGWIGVVVAILSVGGLLATGDAAAGVQDRGQAAERVERAIDLMGGPALASVSRVRLDMMTQWQRTGYRDVPGSDRPSFEPHTDVRDYTIPAWRNTRDFGARKIVNVVRDSVAATSFGDGFQPQSVAYVDERDELFLYTPDRLMLALRAAPDLRTEGDTVVAGERFRRVRGTLPGGLDAVVAFHAGTGLPAMLAFRQGHPNDFGLVPFGAMRVDVWYANWRTFGDISIPTQWDVRRAGAPYKRMTVQRADFDPEFAADSFAIAPEVRTAFLAARGPMHDRPIDSVTVVAPGVVAVHGFGFPAGAVRVGEAWVLLQAGHAPLSLRRASDALAGHGVDRISAAVVARASAGNGGASALVEQGVPVYTSEAAAPFLDVVLEGAGVAPGAARVIRSPGTVAEAGELRLEPLDLPDAPGSLVVWWPERGWLYAPDAATPLDVRIVLDHARDRGWRVDALGTARRLWAPVEEGASDGTG